MQRRAAAMYFAFFVIVGAAAYGLIVTTSAPGVSVQAQQDYSTGDTVELGDRTWTVSSVESGGSGELAWTNESGIVSTSIDNGTEVPAGDLPWNETFLLVVQTENVTDPTEATFVEQRNRTALLAEDPAVYNEINTVNGTTVVTYRNDTNVPFDEYFPPVERRTIAEQETLVYQGNETTVDDISNESVTLTRPATTTETVGLSEGENVTVGGETYFAHFPNNSTVRILPSEERYGDYRAELAAVDSYDQRVLGLWGIVDISIAAVILLLATAFLPVRG